MTSKQTNERIPDNLNFSTFMSMDKEEIADLFITASNPIYLESNDGPMMFALDCALIIFNLGQGEKLKDRLSDVILRGFIHNSPRIRAKSLYVASILLHTTPHIIINLVARMTEIMIENRSALKFLERCFPQLAKNNKVPHDSFLSLIVLSLAERFEDKDLRKTLQKILNDLLLLGNFNEASIDPANLRISPEKKKQASELIFDIAKPHFPSWVKLLLYFPLVEMTTIKMMSPIASGLLSTKGPRSFVRSIARKKITGFLVKTYSQKCSPCNALEMIFFLAGENAPSSSTMSQELAKLFRNPDLNGPDEKQILKFSRYENGLVAWYLYTLIPYYFTRAGKQQDMTIALIEQINDEGGVISKYIAISSLWVITKYLNENLPDAKAKKIEKLYESYCQKFIKNNGAWINFTHNKDTISSNRSDALDSVSMIVNFLNSTKIHGCKASHHKGMISLNYDNGILGTYGEYLGRRKRLTELPGIIIDAVKASSQAEELLLYSINTLGEIGEHYPDDAIKELNVLSHAIETDVDISCKVSNNEALTSSFALTLAKIARIHPSKVFTKIKDFPENWHNLLNLEISSALENSSTDLSQAGESLYQTFLIHYNVRKTFADGIERSGTEDDLREFFGAYTKTVVDWIIKNPDTVLSQGIE